MQKKADNFFDKIVKKNYNDELEKVLEKKYFDENAKNLLLSILYKVETAYKDYTKVKQNVETKEQFIENIIENIKKNCDTIKLVNPSSKESEIMGNRTFLVEKNTKRIICYPIDRKLLYSISKISKNNKIIKEKYFLIDKTLSNLINVGNCINTVEPLRDFNGYSWTTIDREIESIDHNLVYQNLILLLGNEFLNDWIKNNQYIIDYMELFKNKLEEKYGKELSGEIIEILKKLSILIDIKFDKKSRSEILRIKQDTENRLKKVLDNRKFVKLLTEEKIKLTQDIKNIDETVNNRKMIEAEYEKRNELLPLEQKIFSIRILSKMMSEEREEKIEKIEKINKLLNPQNFVKYKKELEEKEKILNIIDTNDLQGDIKRLEIQLQKMFLQCYEKKIQLAENKQELMKLVYEFRYYCLLPFEPEASIIQEEELEKDLERVGKTLIQKANRLKLIEILSKDVEINYEILKNIFNIRIINLEGIYIKVTKEKEKFFIQLFDDNVVEEKIEIRNMNKKNLEFRIGKKIKIFN